MILHFFYDDLLYLHSNGKVLSMQVAFLTI